MTNNLGRLFPLPSRPQTQMKHLPHALDETFTSKAPRLMHNAWVKRRFAIPQTIRFLQALPKTELGFTDVVRLLASRVRLRIETKGEENIPPEGPLVVVANHPFPLVDFYSLGATLESCRSNGRVKVVVDASSKPLTELHPLLTFVGTTEQERSDFWSETQYFLKSGGALIIFPAGHTNFRESRNIPRETSWKAGALKLTTSSNATLLPAYVGAHTSGLYNLLRRLMPRETVQKLNLREAHTQGASVTIQFGKALETKAMNPNLLRQAVYNLGEARFRTKG